MDPLFIYNPKVAPPPFFQSEKSAALEAVSNAYFYGVESDSSIILTILKYLVENGVQLPPGTEDSFKQALAIQKFDSLNNLEAQINFLMGALTNLTPESSPLILIGNAKKTLLNPSLLEYFLPKDLADFFNNPEQIINQYKSALFEKLPKFSEETDSFHAKASKAIINSISSIQQSLSNKLPESLYKNLMESLKLDYQELTSESIEAITQRILSDGLEKTIDQVFTEVFSSLQTTLLIESQKFAKKNLTSLPPIFHDFLPLASLTTPNTKNFWIEIRKKNEGIYDLSFYASDVENSLSGISFPVIFENIPEASFNKEFWLFINRSISFKSDEISITTFDLYKSLESLLNVTPRPKEYKMKGHSTWDMLDAYLGGIDPSITPSIPENTDSFIDTSFFSLFNLQTPSIPNKCIPPFLKHFLKETNICSRDIEIYKEALLEILGTESTEIILDLLKELPKSSPPKPTLSLYKERSLIELLGLDFFIDLSKMRISLLHLIKTLIRVSSFIKELTAYYSTITLFTKLLNNVIPGFALSLSIPVHYFTALLLMHGIPVINEYVPHEWKEKVSSLFLWYLPIKSAIESKILLLVAKFANKFLLDKENIQYLQRNLKIFQAETLQKGELSYDLFKPILEPTKEPTPIITINPTPLIDKTSTLLKKQPQTFLKKSRDIIRWTPLPNESPAFWENIEQPQELLIFFMDWFHQNNETYEQIFKHSEYNIGILTEKIIFIYSFYAIIDGLTRNQKLDFFIPKNFGLDVKNFLYWAKESRKLHLTKWSEEKLKFLVDYFSQYKNSDYTLFKSKDFVDQIAYPDNWIDWPSTLCKGDIAYFETVIKDPVKKPTYPQNLTNLSQLEQYVLFFNQTNKEHFLFPYHSLRSIHYLALITLTTDSTQRTLKPIKFTAKLVDQSNWFVKITNYFINPILITSEHEVPNTFMEIPSQQEHPSRKKPQNEVILQPINKHEKLIRMAFEVKADQIIRTLDIISQNFDLLNDQAFQHTIKKLILDPNAIELAFNDHPNILHDIANQLFEICQKLYNQETDLSKWCSLYIAYIGNDFLFLSEKFDENIRSKTRDFRVWVKNFLITKENIGAIPILFSMFANEDQQRSSKLTKYKILDYLSFIHSKEFLDISRFFDTDLHFQIQTEILCKFNLFLSNWTDIPAKTSFDLNRLIPPKLTLSPIKPSLSINPPKTIPLNQLEHNLHLLSWFQPLSQIDVVVKEDKIQKIIFTHLDLSFSVNSSSGKAFGDSPALSDFFIAPKQNLPSLRLYGNYLLLHSSSGIQKVLLPTLSPICLIGISQTEYKSLSSQWLEKYIPFFNPSNKYYSYFINKQGLLDSNDVDALSYLTLFHFCKGEMDRYDFLQKKLERICKIKSLSKESVSHIKTLLIGLNFSKKPNSRRDFLKLIQSLEENRLLHTKESSFYNEDSLNEKLLFWILIQNSYLNYLKTQESYLSEIDQIFILRHIQNSFPVKKFPFKDKLNVIVPELLEKWSFLHKKYYPFQSQIPSSLASWATSIAFTTTAASLMPKFSLTQPCIDYLEKFIPPDEPLFSSKKITQIQDRFLPIFDALSATDSPSSADPFILDASNPMHSMLSSSQKPLEDLILAPDLAIEFRFNSYYKILYEKNHEDYESTKQKISTLRVQFKNQKTRCLFYILETMTKIDTRIPFPEPGEPIDIYRLTKICVSIRMGVDALSNPKSIFKKIFTIHRVSTTIISSILRPIDCAIATGQFLYNLKGKWRQLPSLPQITPPKKSDLSNPISAALLQTLTSHEEAIDLLLGLKKSEISTKPTYHKYIDHEMASINSCLKEYAKKETPPIYFATNILNKETVFDELEKKRLFIEERSGKSFTELETAFLNGDEIDSYILEEIYKYEISYSRLSAFFNGNSKRAYSFNEIPEMTLRLFLILERRAETLLWPQQLQPLKEILHRTANGVVSQLRMGLGKTDILMPIANKKDANGETIVLNIRPKAIATYAVETSSARSFLLFEQSTNTIPFSREGWNEFRLEAFYLKLISIKNEKQIWESTQEELQSIELRFIEEVIDLEKVFERKNKKSWLNRLEYFQKILLSIKTQGIAHIDEAHIELKVNQELSYPIGAKKQFPEEYAKVINHILITICSDPEISSILNLKQTTPHPISKKLYSKILPLLAKKLSENNPDIEAYFLNQKNYPQGNTSIHLIKGILNEILPNVLEEIIHVNYTTSNVDFVKYAKPSNGNKSPEESSSFKDPFISFLKTGLLFLYNRLKKSEITEFIEYLQKKAKEDSKLNGLKIEDSRAAIYFSTISNGLSLFDPTISFEKLNENDKFILDYARIFASSQIEFYPHSLSSNAHNFTSMLQSFLGYTGSPYNASTYPLNTHTLIDRATDGESIELLQQMRPPIDILYSTSSTVILEEFLEKQVKNFKETRAFIDRGAICNGISNKNVAEKIKTFIEKHRPDLRGVVFYNEANELMMWEIHTKNPIPFEQSTLSEKERFTYFDEGHSFGSNIPQEEKTHGVVSIGELTTLEGLLQAIWRLRGLKTKEQTISFIMTETTHRKIFPKNPSLFPNAHPYVNLDSLDPLQPILKFVLSNEQNQLLYDNFASDCAALYNIVRRAFLDKALGSSIKTMIDMIREQQEFFVSTDSIDPKIRFGGIDTFINPKTRLNQLKRYLIEKIIDSGRFTSRELDLIVNNFNKIGEKSYPTEVSTKAQISTSATQKVSHQSQITEKAQQQEETQKKDQILRTQFFVSSKSTPKEHIHFDSTPLKVLLDKVDTKQYPEITNTPVSIYSLKNLLCHHPIAKFIDPRICATTNFIPDPMNAFNQPQIPTHEALLLEEDGKITRVVLLSQEDAKEWREKLKSSKDSIAILDIPSRIIVKTAQHYTIDENLLRKPDFELLISQIAFLSGDSHYLTDSAEFSQWINNIELQSLKSYFIQTKIHENPNIRVIMLKRQQNDKDWIEI